MEIVYVFTNLSFPDWVKIGRCKDLKARLKSLSQNTATPLPFRCFYACKVADAKKVEKQLHSVFAQYRVSSRREFFKVDAEMVVNVLQLVAEEEVVIEEPEVDQSITQANDHEASIQARFQFIEAGVALGEKIYLTRFPTLKATVIGQERVSYEGADWTLSQLTEHLVPKHYGYTKLKTSAPRYWSYEGKPLVALKHIRLSTTSND